MFKSEHLIKKYYRGRVFSPETWFLSVALVVTLKTMLALISQKSRRRLYYYEGDMAVVVRDYGSRGRVLRGKGGMPAGGWRRKLRDHIFIYT